MYGLVNRAIEQLVVATAGEPAWRQVCARAGVSPDGFIGMQAYPDDMTYRLVGAASEVLGHPPETVLRLFGEYWIVYTAEEGYGELLGACGHDMRSFLAGLDEMHGRVESTFPEMVLPRFTVRDAPDDGYLLHYSSTRAGLAPMVEGLLAGLAQRFGTEVSIERVQRREDGAPEDVFHLRHRGPGVTAATSAEAASQAATEAAQAMARAMAVEGVGCPHARAAMEAAGRRK